MSTWEEQNFNTAIGESMLSKAGICLSNSSTEYWANNNHNEGEIEERVTPAHMDVGGFVVGCVLNAVNLDNLSSAPIPEIMAAGIMTGVIAPSGVVGRIGNCYFLIKLMGCEQKNISEEFLRFTYLFLFCICADVLKRA